MYECKVFSNNKGEVSAVNVSPLGERNVNLISLSNCKISIISLTDKELEDWKEIETSAKKFAEKCLNYPHGATNQALRLLHEIVHGELTLKKEISMARKKAASKEVKEEKKVKLVGASSIKKEDKVTPVAEQEESAPRGKVPAIANSAKIKLLVKENPKREGSSSFDRFELYRTSKTVEEFIAAGGTRGDINYDLAREYIAVS